MPLGIMASAYVVPSGGGGFLPTDLSGLRGWYDAGDAASFTFSSGVLVSQWADKSGGSHHLVQATTTKQPSRNGTQNSLSTVVFTSSRNDRLGPTTWTDVPNPISQFLVVKYTVTDGNTHDTVQGDGGISLARLGGGDNRFEIWTEGYGARTAISSGTWYEFSMAVNGAASTYRMNGTQFDSGSSGSGGLFSNWGMGGALNRPTSQSLSGEVAEFIVYNRLLSGTELGQVDTYLKTKWGIS